MSGQKRSIEQTETENKAGRNRIRRAEGEKFRCIEYTGWLYIAEKEQTSRDFQKKCRQNGTEGGLLTTKQYETASLL